MGDLSESKSQDTYTNRFGAIMSMVGMCVGMGNVWKFPYMVGTYGGGAFIIAYLICMFVIVIPLAIMECGFGKGIKKGLMSAYEQILKNKVLGKIIGGIFSFLLFSMNFFYIIVVGASLYFAFACARRLWKTVPADQIYDDLMIHQPILVLLSIFLILATGFIVARGVSGGIEKISKIMIPLMFLFFIIAIIFSIFSVDNIAKGYDYYLNPNFSALKDPKLWAITMGQALFSIGVGPGSIFVYGSHLKEKSDVTMTMTTVCLLDCCVAILAGMAIIPSCIGMGLNPKSGSKLIFVVLPAMFERLPFGNIIGLLVFLAIFFAGFSSAIAQLEVAVSTFSDGLKWSRKKAVLIFVGINIICSVIAVYNGNFYNFWNNFSGNFAFIITASIGAVLYGYAYGVEKIRVDYLNPFSDVKVGRWFTKYVQFVAIPVMLLIMINSLVSLIG
jgi:NSS family neurotransmitter:Na+ symporter